MRNATFQLLSSDTFVISKWPAGCLHFGRFIYGTDDSSIRDTRTTSVEWLNILELPRAVTSYQFITVSRRSWDGSPKIPQLSRPHITFSPARSLISVVIDLSNRAEEDGHPLIVITIHQDVLLRLTGALERRSKNHNNEIGLVPWVDWGPEFTSCQRIPSFRSGRVTIFGQRQGFLMTSHDTDPNTTFDSQLLVRDYNPPTVKYYLSHPVPGVKVVHGEQRECGGLFVGDVVTNLPFVEYSRTIPGLGVPCRNMSFWIDQEHIVFANFKIPRGEAIFGIHGNLSLIAYKPLLTRS